MGFILGLGTALPTVAGTGIGTVTGLSQGISRQRRENREAANPDSRMVKFHVNVSVDPELCGSPLYDTINNGIVVLKDDKLWVEKNSGPPSSHPFTGFFLQYPDEHRVPPVRGLVSTIQPEPPMLNWVYVDKDTYELKYLNRSGSIEHIVGEWDWTDESQDSRLTFDGWEPFVAIEEKEGWALYVDYEDNGLKGRKKSKSLECQLSRRIIEDQFSTSNQRTGDRKGKR